MLQFVPPSHGAEEWSPDSVDGFSTRDDPCSAECPAKPKTVLELEENRSTYSSSSNPKGLLYLHSRCASTQTHAYMPHYPKQTFALSVIN